MGDRAVVVAAGVGEERENGSGCSVEGKRGESEGQKREEEVLGSFYTQSGEERCDMGRASARHGMQSVGRWGGTQGGQGMGAWW